MKPRIILDGRYSIRRYNEARKKKKARQRKKLGDKLSVVRINVIEDLSPAAKCNTKWNGRGFRRTCTLDKNHYGPCISPMGFIEGT